MKQHKITWQTVVERLHIWSEATVLGGITKDEDAAGRIKYAIANEQFKAAKELSKELFYAGR